ncbi:RHS repeat-associated core domain-containing protein [Pseudomonas sp. Sample_24]|uniref:RHS repeat-associated core domain-containing protein n=1 Tax=Pseudomonas sp. Sample_24 TaxID=2448268 RepID=UPI001032DF7B|nr:RHS repeat-associated core domain-containing protein [Pseudomonas sp. Sample_24]
MPFPQEDVLCRYHYDPLDRLVSTTPIDDAGLQRFYCKNRLATEIQGSMQRAIFQHDDQLLAQHDRQNHLVESSLLVTDQMRSVLQVVRANHSSSITYTPYGHRLTGDGLLSLLGFNGARPEPITGHYLLGNGYRAFNPILMRFNSPDSLSPFGRGGLNSYAYCSGDPINRYDESGHISTWKFFKTLFKIKEKPAFSFSPPPTPRLSSHYTMYERLLDKDVPSEVILQQYKKARSKGYSLRVPIAKVSSAKSLKLIPDTHQLYKSRTKTLGGNQVSFVFTQHEELFIGSSGHLGLSVAAGSPKVISAGEITRTGVKSFSITNNSGHFKPAYASLDPVKERLESFGAKVSTVRFQA